MTKPTTIEELAQHVKELRETMEKSRDYSTSAQYVLNVALAAFEFAAHEQGITGFQAHWIALNFLADVNNIKGPFAVLSAERMLYPQYETPTQLAAKYEEDFKPWLGEQARKKLEEHEGSAAPQVIEHWKRLAEYPLPEKTGEDMG